MFGSRRRSTSGSGGLTHGNGAGTEIAHGDPEPTRRPRLSAPVRLGGDPPLARDRRLAEATTTGAAILPGGYLLAALAAFALLAGYATGRLAPTAAYVLGAGPATLLLVAYAGVHAFGYAGSALGLEPHGGHGTEPVYDHGHADGGHDHGVAGHERGHDEKGTLAVLAEHLRGDAYALASKTAEAAAAVCFATLAALER